jgi:diguanylate cyclase (GGDEF)-like protein/PAS domain S-box-containing protein
VSDGSRADFAGYGRKVAGVHPVEVGVVSRAGSRRVLLIAGDPEDSRVIGGMMQRQGADAFELARVDNVAEAERYVAEHEVDVILVDMGSGGSSEQEIVQRIGGVSQRVPMVLLLSAEVAAKQAMQKGAQDYLIKGEFEASELVRALENAIERRSIEEALFAEKERAQVTLDSIGDAVISTDIEGKITFLNPVAERLTGWAVPEACGHSTDEVFKIVDPATRETIANPMEAAIKRNRVGRLPGNCILIRRDGQEIYIEDSAAAIHGRDGKITGSVIIFRDVSMARKLVEETIHASQHDFLTGLPNRLLLEDRLGQAIALAERHLGEVAVLYMDLDGFKHINDSLGHLVGDKLLQSIAERLREQIRTPDTVSRQGGDEFVMLLQDVQTQKDAEVVAKRILEAVTAVHTIGEHQLSVTASIGVSLYPEDGLDAETLMKNADTAMYQAKASGRRCFKFFKPAMNARAAYRRSIEEDLRQALGRGELQLHYQPTINLKTGAIAGVEALLRWTNATRGAVAPAKFISVAEESGLMMPIGAWVLREACRQAKSWVDQGLPPVRMAVNASAVQLHDEGFLNEVMAALGETGLSPGVLELELTETVLMHLPERAQSVLQHLRERGVKVSIDDFGSGYSSLSHLKKLPIDVLKMDRSFLHPLNDPPDETSITVAIIRMGRSLNLRVVAEGVESAEDMKFLRAHDCDEAQGFYFSPPVPAEQLEELLKKRQFHWKKSARSRGNSADPAKKTG